MTNSIDRAKIAVGAKSDSDLARWLGLTQSVMTGYRRRESVPLEQCIKIAEQTGVSLDWLILGKGQMQPENGTAQAKKNEPALSPEQQMLLTGFAALHSTEAKSRILQAVLQELAAQ